MRRIHTCNARRRARARRALGCDVLQSWECYVEDCDTRYVDLVMHDLTNDRGEQREYGSFPRRLFPNVEIRRGLVVIVEVLRCRRISIRTVPRDPDAPEIGSELVGLLELLRLEDDNGASPPDIHQ